jgi:hypothetical protein
MMIGRGGDCLIVGENVRGCWNGLARQSAYFVMLRYSRYSDCGDGRFDGKSECVEDFGREQETVMAIEDKLIKSAHKVSEQDPDQL